MAQSFDDLFGGGSNGGGKYLKWEQVGDEVLLIQTGPAFHQVQTKFQTGEPKYLIRTEPGGKMNNVRYLGVDGFDPADLDDDDYWQPKDLVIPVRHVATRRNGETVNDAEFDVKWEVNKGDQHAKLRDAFLELGEPVDVGTKYIVKYIQDGKPRKYSIRIKNAE